MKRHMRPIAFLLSLLLLALSFSGCELNEMRAVYESFFHKSVSAQQAEETLKERERSFVRFSDMQYEAQDIAAIIAEADALCEAVPSCISFAQLADIVERADSLFYTYATMYTLAMIHSECDMRDSYWMGEARKLGEGFASIDAVSSRLLNALYKSPYRRKIEKEWGADFFDALRETEFISDVTQSLYERIAVLQKEYTELLTIGTVRYRGKDLTISDIESMWNTSGAHALWLDTYNALLGQMHVEMIKLRGRIAREAGFDSYTDMAFYSGKKDYTPEMVQSLLYEIEQNLVPVYRALDAREALYIEPYADVSYAELTLFLEDTFRDLMPEVNEALRVMHEYGLYDLTPRPNKIGGAYVAYIYNYDAPFLMGSYEDDFQSICTVVHELGHFYNGYTMMKDATPVTDINEIHSQAMELLVSDYYQPYFGTIDGYAMQIGVVTDTVKTMVEQPYYTAFELRAYALSEDELTLEALNNIAYEEALRFGNDEYAADYFKLAWVRVPHMVEQPFYTLSYATSASVAMEIWEIARTDKKAALDAYQSMIELSGGGGFLENLEYAGLSSPFSPGRIQEIAEFADKYLNNSGKNLFDKEAARKQEQSKWRAYKAA